MTFITIFVLFLVGLLAALYIMRSRLISLMSASITGLMLFSGVAVVIAVFIPGIFTFGASQTLEHAGTLEVIRKADGTISFSGVTAAATNAWDTITGWFGNTPTPTPAPKEVKKGLLEQNIYPELVGAIAGIYRGLTIGLGLVFMGLSVYLSYATASVAETASLAQRVAELEAKLAEKES